MNTLNNNTNNNQKETIKMIHEALKSFKSKEEAINSLIGDLSVTFQNNKEEELSEEMILNLREKLFEDPDLQTIKNTFLIATETCRAYNNMHEDIERYSHKFNSEELNLLKLISNSDINITIRYETHFGRKPSKCVSKIKYEIEEYYK